jgi:two-component system sensor histidine kinase UhpB
MSGTNAFGASANDLRLVIDTISVMAWIVLPDGTLEFVNRPWLDYAGLSMEEALADPAGTIHPEDQPRVAARWREHLSTGLPHTDEMRLRGADGEYRWFLVRTVPLRAAGEVVRWYGTSTDIEGRVRAEERLQALRRRMVEMQETERRELSRELHDRAGQMLTAMLLNLDLIRARPAVREDPEARSRVDDSRQLIQSAFAAVKDVMYEMRPPMLDEHGLVAPLQWYARGFADRMGIPLNVVAEAGWRCDPEVELALFRIAQEGLTNVARHSKATSAVVTLLFAPDAAVLIIEDNGVGLPQAPRQGPPGYGLITNRERAESVRGTFAVGPRPGGGTRLCVRVPVRCTFSPG